MIPELKDLTYEQRLRSLKLFSLRHRRRRGDILQLYSLFRSEDETAMSYLNTNITHYTRGHNRKLSVIRPATNIRKNTFFLRVANDWNSLPQNIINSKTMDSFKRALDKHWSKDPSIYN
jgi:hypothetical protein